MKKSNMIEHLGQAIRYRLGLGFSLVEQNILGRDISVRYGMVPEKSDYDEGWTYFFTHQSSVMFDIGCNVGWCSLLACIDNPKRRIIALDANPKALIAAAEMLTLNGCIGQVQFVLGFASDQLGKTLDFFTVGTGAAGSRYRSHAKTASKKNSFFKVTSTTLDEIVKTYGIFPDFIKIDIEGAEAEAMNGAKAIGSNRQTRFLVEMHRTQEIPMKENGEMILSWCREFGYDAYFLKEHRKVTNAEPFCHRGRCHLMLQPSEWSYPDLIRQINESDSIEKVQKLFE